MLSTPPFSCMTATVSACVYACTPAAEAFAGSTVVNVSKNASVQANARFICYLLSPHFIFQSGQIEAPGGGSF